MPTKNNGNEVKPLNPDSGHDVFLFEEAPFLTAVVNSSPDSIIGLNLSGVVISWNPAAERLFGYSRDDAIGQNIRFLMPPERWTEEDKIEARINKGETIIDFHSTRIRKDGTQVEVSVTISPVIDADGVVVGLARIGRDITELKRTEERLRLLGGAIESAANGVVISNLRGKIIWVNSAFEKMTGYDSGEVIGQNLNVLKSGKHQPAFYREMWETVIRGGVWKGELTNRRKNGTYYPEDMTITPVRNAAGKITHFIAIKQDITERLQASAEREQLIVALQHALMDVKTLSGLLPICSSCKKVRDDKGYWNLLEIYISKHSNTQLTHGICPECAQKMLDELSGMETI